MAPLEDNIDGGGGGGDYYPYIPPVVAVPPPPAPAPYIPPLAPAPYILPDPVLPNDPVIVYSADGGAVTVPAWTVGLTTAPAAPASDNIIGGGSGYMAMPTPEPIYQWTPMPVPVPPTINAPIAMDGSGATSVVTQPAPVDSPAPNQNVVAYVAPPVSPAPAPTVAASPANFLPSQGLALPQSSGVQVVVNPDGTYSVVAGNQSATSTVTTWLQSQSLITGYPNWEVALGALAVLWFLKRGKR